MPKAHEVTPTRGLREAGEAAAPAASPAACPLSTLLSSSSRPQNSSSVPCSHLGVEQRRALVQHLPQGPAIPRPVLGLAASSTVTARGRNVHEGRWASGTGELCRSRLPFPTPTCVRGECAKGQEQLLHPSRCLYDGKNPGDSCSALFKEQH